jgi:hypothetical protein
MWSATCSGVPTARDYESQIAVPAATFVDGAPIGRPLWRVELYTRRGLVKKVVIAAEHIVFDFNGIRSWESQFRKLVRGEPHLVGRIRHPLDHSDESSKTRQVMVNSMVEERRPQFDFMGQSWPMPVAETASFSGEADVPSIKDTWSAVGGEYAQLFGAAVDGDRVGVVQTWATRWRRSPCR